MNKDFAKNKIILAVKNNIANQSSIESYDGVVVRISLDSLDIDHIAEDIAEEVMAMFNAENKKLRKLLFEEIYDNVSSSYSIYSCAEICPKKNLKEIQNCRNCTEKMKAKKIFDMRLKESEKK